jgi:DNA-binding NarL/FixJ family response regulator
MTYPLKLRVLLAEDHQLVRQGLRSMLENESDIEVVAEAVNGEEAVELAKKWRPKIVVMDIGLPRLNGLEATQRIAEDMPDVKVLILSVQTDRRSVSRALRRGASGYMQKDSAFEELARALRVVARGKTYLSPSITGVLVEDYVRVYPEDLASKPSVLTPREREVLQLIAEGHTTKEIASLLWISVKTVETHRRNIMRKVKLHSVAELTKYAVQEGITSPQV